jgi:hypothetical protein
LRPEISTTTVQKGLYVVEVHGNTLYRNNGDGTFTDITQAAGASGLDDDGGKLCSISAAWIDYDNDGNLDLFSNYCVTGSRHSEFGSL